jgi:galactonate dehydratase
LWDIAGKAAGLPVYRMVGGKCRDRIRVYQAPRGGSPEELAENALALIEKYGYTAIKMGPLPGNWHTLPWNEALRQAERRVGAVREAVGPNIDIGLDPHARIFEVSRAMELCAVVAQFRPFFVEEPLRPENYDALAKLAAKVDVPLATGEMLYTRHEFRELINLQAVNIIQPDICTTSTTTSTSPSYDSTPTCPSRHTPIRETRARTSTPRSTWSWGPANGRSSRRGSRSPCRRATSRWCIRGRAWPRATACPS